MKITKDYPGLAISENGEYILNGDLISEEGIEIDLDNRLVVTGSIKAKYGIKAICGIKAGWDIQAGFGIKAVFGIEAVCGITAGWGIKAGLNITSWDGIIAGWGIEAGTYIDCGKRIFAGTSVYTDDDDCDKTIQCAELRNGTVAYGDLIITKREASHED